MVMIFKDTECLLFDMDGVILDNTYDNNFWQNQIPSVLAKKRQISFEDAKRLAIQIFNYKKNSKDWYDLDYWSNMLDIDLEEQKKAKESFEKIRLIIKPHEKIYESRKIERADQMMNINTQIGPIYVSYPSDENIANLLLSIKKNPPTYDFESFDKSIHRLWCVNDKNFIREFTNLAINIKHLYIADGHHRIGAMQHIKKINPLIERFMIAAFPSNECKIFDYNRVIKDLNGLSKDQFIKNLSNDFKVLKVDNAYKPLTKNEFGMYHDNQWYILEFINSLTSNDFIDDLDINILNQFCLTKMLNIKDVNNDERIRFIAGCHGLSALEKKVDENTDSVAFSIFPSKITDVIRVADNNLTMPPKSTWFDPKPLDGLVVYEFN